MFSKHGIIPVAEALDIYGSGSRLPATFVTPGGDVVDAAGISGGHREVAQGPVGRRSSAAELDRA